jgi:thiamine kinase-like enzyme
VDRSALRDYLLRDMPSPGPFPCVKSFHDWFSRLPDRHFYGHTISYDHYRPLVNDRVPIMFTHGDIHRHNILVRPDDPAEVLSIVDWAHAGWYPIYWEYFRPCYHAVEDDEWREEWLPKFLHPYPCDTEVFTELQVTINGF